MQGPNDANPYDASSALADVTSSGVFTNIADRVGAGSSNTITITTDADGIITNLTIDVNDAGIAFNGGGQPFNVPGPLKLDTLASGLKDIYSGAAGSKDIFFEGMSYSVYGAWAYMHTGDHRRAGTLATGIEAPTAALTGNAIYNGSAFGVVLTDTSSMAFTGDAQVKVDFSAPGSNITTTFSNLVTRDADTNAIGSLPTLTGTGSLYSGTSRYSTDLEGGEFSGGGVYGAFYGPNAEETAGIFQVGNTAPSTKMITGSYGAKK